MQETRVQSLGQEDPLEKEMATHSSIFDSEMYFLTQSLLSIDKSNKNKTMKK